MSDTRTASALRWLVGALLLLLPWPAARALHLPLEVGTVVVLSGLSIVGAGFIATWAMEAAQADISPALATIFVALVAVLPEYAVDLYYAWGAGRAMETWNGAPPIPMAMGLPSANMTGANRLLIGLGWPMVVCLNAWKTRRGTLDLGEEASLELTFLSAATLYAFVIPLKDSLSVVDGVVFLLMFLLYIRRAGQAPLEEIEMEGAAFLVASLPGLLRRILTAGMFLFAAGAILIAAEPFAGGLIHIGGTLGIEPFVLVQWLAPIASESPEFIVSALLALQGNGRGGLAALVSSKVNQWTLLVGMIPFAVCVAAGGAWGLPLDDRQRDEILLTAAQSAFGIALLAGHRISLWDALALVGLFVAQIFVPHPAQRAIFSAVYGVLAVAILIVRPHAARRLGRGLAGLLRR